MRARVLRSTNDTQLGYVRFNDILEDDVLKTLDSEKMARWIKRKIIVEIEEPKKDVKKDVVKEPKKEKATKAEAPKEEIVEEEIVEEEFVDDSVEEELDLEALRKDAKELKIPYYKQMKAGILKAKVVEAKAGVAKLHRRTVN